MILFAMGFVVGTLAGVVAGWLIIAALVNRIEKRRAFAVRSHSSED